MGLPAALPLAGLILWRDDPDIGQIAAGRLFLLLNSVRYMPSLCVLSDPDHITGHTDRGWVTVCGTMVGEPDVRDPYSNLRLAVDRVEVEDEEHLVKGESCVSRSTRLSAS